MGSELESVASDFARFSFYVAALMLLGQVIVIGAIFALFWTNNHVGNGSNEKKI